MANEAPREAPDSTESSDNYGEAYRASGTRGAKPDKQPMKEPETFEEAVSGSEARQWNEAIAAELSSMERLAVWEPSVLPKDRKPISCRWLFKRKTNPSDPAKVRFRARLVIRGFSQTPFFDFSPDNIYAPVARAESTKLMLSLAAEEGLVCHQCDISSAFLYAPLEEEIYMEPPKGFKLSENKVLLLRKALYGLKQSPAMFHKTLAKILGDMGLKPLKTELCIFTSGEKGNRFIALVYVDDLMLLASKQAQIEAFLKTLSAKFEITHQKLSYYLGIEIHHEPDGAIHINQAQYAMEIVERFEMQNHKTAASPSDKTIYDEDDSLPCPDRPYSALIGALMYLATITRFDIAFTVNYLAKFSSRPTERRWNEALRVLKYIAGTASHGITFRPGNYGPTEVYSDADHAADIQTRKSVSGAILLRQGGAIAWNSTRQTTVAQSSTEAEFLAASNALRSSIWVTKLLSELGINEKHTLLIDNISAIRLIKNSAFHRRSKHIALSEMMIRDHYQKGEIDLKYVNTTLQEADILTKSITGARLQELLKLTGLTALHHAKKKTDAVDHGHTLGHPDTC